MVNFNYLYEALQPAINAVIGSTAAPQATANTYGIPKPIYNYAKQKIFDQFLPGNTAGSNTRGGASPGGLQDLDISAITDLGSKIISGLGDINFSQASDFALKAVNLVQANTKGKNSYGTNGAVGADGTLWSTMFDGLKSTWGYAEAHPVQSFMLSTLLGSGISIPTLISTLGSVAGPMGGVVGSFISMWQTTFGNAMTGQVLNVVQTLGREMHKRGVPVHAALLLALVVAGIAVSSIDPAILENLKQIMSKKYQDWRTDL